jgi:hypothetical protein
MNEITIPADVAREIAKLIRNVDDGKLENWASMLDPVNISDRVYRIINFYINSNGDPNLATHEIINEVKYLINNVRIIEDAFILKKDLINLIENGVNV